MPDIISITTPPLSPEALNHPDSSKSAGHRGSFESSHMSKILKSVHNTQDERPAENRAAGNDADHPVPLGEDCLRGFIQVFRVMGDVAQCALSSAVLEKMLPNISGHIIKAACSLHNALIHKRDMDIAVLDLLGLMSGYLPYISGLAASIRSTIISYVGDCFLLQSPDKDDSHPYYLHLALLVVVANYYISDNRTPQRALCRGPALLSRFVVRARRRWHSLGDMAQNAISPKTSASQPAFEIESNIVTISDGSSATIITDLTVNSTVNPEAYTKATVKNRSTKTQGATYSLEQQAHAWAMDHLMRYSGLFELLACITTQTQTQQYQDEVKITHTYFNSKCEAMNPSEPQHKPATSFERQTQESVSRASSAAERSHVYTVLPMVVSAAPVVNIWTQALKSTEMRVAGGAAILTGLAFGARKIWNTFAARNDGEAIPPSQDAHKGGKHHHRTEREKIDTNLAKKMQVLDIIDDGRDAGSFKKEEIIAAVGIYLFAPDPRFTHYINGLDDRLEKVAKTILRVKKLYGGRRDEEVSAARAGMLVRNWLFDTVLGMPVESWLAGKLAVLKHPEQFNASVMKTLLNSDVLRSTGVIDLEALSDGQRQLFEKFWDYALDNTLPFTNFLAADEVASLSATDDAFVWLHSGALWLKDAGEKLSDFSAEECQELGKIIWQRVESGDIDMSYQRYLTLPALLFEAVNPPEPVSGREEDDFAHRLQAVERYARLCPLT